MRTSIANGPGTPEFRTPSAIGMRRTLRACIPERTANGDIHRALSHRRGGPDPRSQGGVLRNFACRAFNENQAWLEVVLTAVDLVCWTKPLPRPTRRRPTHPRSPQAAPAGRPDLALAVHIAEGFPRLRAPLG